MCGTPSQTYPQRIGASSFEASRPWCSDRAPVRAPGGGRAAAAGVAIAASLRAAAGRRERGRARDARQRDARDPAAQPPRAGRDDDRHVRRRFRRRYAAGHRARDGAHALSRHHDVVGRTARGHRRAHGRGVQRGHHVRVHALLLQAAVAVRRRRAAYRSRPHEPRHDSRRRLGDRARRDRARDSRAGKPTAGGRRAEASPDVLRGHAVRHGVRRHDPELREDDRRRHSRVLPRVVPPQQRDADRRGRYRSEEDAGVRPSAVRRDPGRCGAHPDTDRRAAARGVDGRSDDRLSDRLRRARIPLARLERCRLRRVASACRRVLEPARCARRSDGRRQDARGAQPRQRLPGSRC